MHYSRKTVLIVDDDRNFSASLKMHLDSDAIEAHLAHSAEECLAFCGRKPADVVLLDQKLPDAQGADLCAPILGFNERTKIIFTTAYPSFDNAVKAIREGAFDYLAKPFELEQFDLVLKHALRTLDLEKVEQFQRYRSERDSEEHVLAGSSQAIAEIRRLIGLAADADAPVLVTGETGAGKTVAAHAIHYRGKTPQAPFVSINCAALPETLIEAELFGSEKGAFTGAAARRKGLIETAEGGTLFLDEIGEMPVALQSKLLGVLDNGAYRRIGGTAELRADVRVIAATGVELEQAVKRRKFREDLYYRLGVIKLQIPPLRARASDLPELCTFLLEKIAKGRRVRLAEGEAEKLARYAWPGNVRELKNVIERAVILQQGPDLRPSEFLPSGAAPIVREKSKIEPRSAEAASAALHDVEKEHILSALSQHNGNFSRTARAIGISLSTLKRRLKSYEVG
jgi:DNA-binding NtrC family response regulator